MEVWSILFLLISVIVLIRVFHGFFFPTRRPTLPPGPFSLPVIGNFQLLFTSYPDLEDYITSLHFKFGPLVTLTLGSKKMIFINDASLAHEALVHNGELFANRPVASPVETLISCHQHNINTSFYGPNWRLLRKNLTSTFRHMSNGLSPVLQILTQQFKESRGPVKIFYHLSSAMFFGLSLSCFGEDADYKETMELRRSVDAVAARMYEYPLFDVFPKVARILLKRQWEEFQKLVRCNEELILKFINARKRTVDEDSMNRNNGVYVDTLFAIELPEEKRKLSDGELVSLCFEFLLAGADPTTTALQWIFANLVKHSDVQEKLYAEMEGVICGDAKEIVIEQHHLKKMKYLKAVVFETLRLYPPAHFLLPHAVVEDVVLAGHLIPKNGSLHFVVAELGKDPRVWKEAMEFRPERFMESEGEVDMTGTKEIKMMPFGAGRRTCPGYGLAMEQMEYMVANLVWRFQWKEVEGVGVDLSEDRQFTVGMKNPLLAYCIPR